MGIRLIVEILDHWQDAGLTAGERWDLFVLAENANDGTRLTFGPVHAQHILDRANKSPKGWKNAITALMRKKVITTHLPGRINQCAVYHLEPLCPDPPHSGYKGQCTKPVAGSPEDPAKGVGDAVTPDPEEGHLSDDPLGMDQEEGHLSGDPEGHPADDPLGQEGHPAGDKRVIQEVTPTPLYSSFKDSPLSTSSSSVAEDIEEGSVRVADGTGGGGGGNLDSSEDQQQNDTRAEALVAQLDFRGKAPDKQQQKQLRVLVAAALAAGWSENGLMRYLDISDDRDVKNAAGLYAYRLNPKRLPDAGEAEAISNALPPVCAMCSFKPGADTDPSLRVHPFGGPCPKCHPASVVQSATELPPVCDTCRAQNPAAEFNIKFRQDPMSFTGAPCPRCHPDMVGPDRPGADGGMWDRAMDRAQQRMGARAETHTADAYTASSVDDLFGPRRSTLPGAGPKPMVAPTGYQPYQNTEDQSGYDEPFPAPTYTWEDR